MPLLNDHDWQEVFTKTRATEASEAPANFVPWQLANDPATYGDKAGWWLVVSPDFEDEIAGPVATREECDRIINELEQGRAEAAADPYPERMYPEVGMN